MVTGARIASDSHTLSVRARMPRKMVITTTMKHRVMRHAIISRKSECFIIYVLKYSLQ